MGRDALTKIHDAFTIMFMMPKTKPLTLKVTRKMGQPITEHQHFAMVELEALEGLGDLIKRAPKAAQLAVALIRRMQSGSGGVVVCSRETMRELLGCSMPTVERALRLLMEEGWVQRIRIGGANALAINHRVAWIGNRGEIQHAVFGATVIASRSEQDAMALNPPPMKNLPILRAGEELLPFGDGLEPPSQQELDGTHAAVIQGQLSLGGLGQIDPETGEIT
jgi:DNA-binding transcriptional MocR family regulator